MNYLQTDQLILSYELATIVAFAGAVYLVPRRVWRSCERCLKRIAAKLSLEGNPLLGAVLIAGLVTLLCDFAFAALVRLPEANYHDEFSYLLAAETFAAGRLTNPSPEFGDHFESFHILTIPSYQSKYPPGQGLFLALGLIVGGFAGLGVWLSHAVAVGGICWFLGQFTAVRWALLGALSFGLHDRVVMWWGQTYWGGAVAALGGALLFGGFAGWLRDCKTSSSVMMGIGAGVLAASRPAEGGLCCLGVLVGLAAQFYRSPEQRRTAARCVAGGIAGVAPLLLLLAIYNQSVTGNPLRLPYQAWIDQYHIGLSGPVAELKPQSAMTPFGRYQYDFFSDQEYRYKSSFAFWKLAFRLRPFYLPGLTLIALLGVRRPRSLVSVVLTGSVLVVLSFIFFNPAGGFPHYLSPVAAPITLGIVFGLRRAFCRIPGTRPSMGLVALAVCICLGGFRLAVVWPAADAITGKSVESARHDLMVNLETRQLDGLVLVLYGPGHLPAAEYVYNGSELRSSSGAGGPRIVWARALDESRDRQLVASYPDRAAYVYFLDQNGGALIEFEEFAQKNRDYSLVTTPR